MTQDYEYPAEHGRWNNPHARQWVQEHMRHRDQPLLDAFAQALQPKIVEALHASTGIALEALADGMRVKFSVENGSSGARPVTYKLVIISMPEKDPRHPTLEGKRLRRTVHEALLPLYQSALYDRSHLYTQRVSTPYGARLETKAGALEELMRIVDEGLLSKHGVAPVNMQQLRQDVRDQQNEMKR